MMVMVVCGDGRLFSLILWRSLKKKLNMPQYGGLAFETCWLIGFLDCKFDETCAPGSGPMMDEELVDQWEEEDLIQEAVYSGYVKAHGIKVLTVLFPNGITGYLYGPISGRKSDIAVLNMPWLNHQLLLLQEDVEPPLGGELHEMLEAENMATNSVRTSIQWTYGDIIVLFHVMHETYSKKYFLPDRTINDVLHQQLRVVFFIYTTAMSALMVINLPAFLIRLLQSSVITLLADC
jgi:hypothetical protein